MVLVILFGLLASLAVFPRTLAVFGKLDADHSGITASVPLLATYHLAIVAGFLYVVLFDKFRIPGVHRLFLLFTPVLIITAWGGTITQWAGYFHYVGAIIAWGIGYSLARKLGLHKPVSSIWAMMLGGVMLLQLGLTIMQVSGIELPLWLGGTDRDATQRAYGTLSNPGNLSKVSFYFLMLLLPLTTSKLRLTRRWAIVGVFAAVVVTCMTVSRANMAAVGSMLAIWALVVPGRLKISHRLGTMAGIIVAGWLFAGEFFTRFTTDDLDPRTDLMDAALQYLPEYFWMGMGPNSYVPIIGAIDGATDIPVHNTFLLAVMELGILLAIVLLAPVVMLAFRALRAVRQGRSGNIFLWAFLASVPGHIAIMWTGWGVLSGFILPLLFLFLGILDRQTSRRPLETMQPLRESRLPVVHD
jgi:hypothetical protein